MHQVFESSPYLWMWGSSFRNRLATPEVEEIVLEEANEVERGGPHYPTAVYENGRFRMWYNCWKDKKWSAGWSEHNAYAESDDGLSWTRPKVGIVEYNGSTDNNLVNLIAHCPSVFVDPTAPARERYRAFGWMDRNGEGLKYYGWAQDQKWSCGYYTYHSSDGFDWRYDTESALWRLGDTCSACWDPYSRCARYSLKKTLRYGRLIRRSIYESTMRNGVFTEPVPAFIPDDYDDIRARAHGGIDSSFYKMAWLPDEDLTFAFLPTWYQEYPYETSELDDPLRALYYPLGGAGHMHITVAYQEKAGGAWRRFPGRPSFLAPTAPGTVYEFGYITGSGVVRAKGRDYLYFNNNPMNHGEVPLKERFDKERVERFYDLHTHMKIGVAHWPSGRLQGAYTPMIDELELRLDGSMITEGSRLRLNAETYLDGNIRVGLYDTALPENEFGGRKPIEGYSTGDCVPLTGSHLDTVVRWKKGEVLPKVDVMRQLAVRLCVEHGAVYQFAVD